MASKFGQAIITYLDLTWNSGEYEGIPLNVLTYLTSARWIIWIYCGPRYIPSKRRVTFINVVFWSIPLVKNPSSVDVRSEQFPVLRARPRFVLEIPCLAGWRGEATTWCNSQSTKSGGHTDQVQIWRCRKPSLNGLDFELSVENRGKLSKHLVIYLIA